MLTAHYTPAKMAIADRFKFNRRYQQHEEDVAAFSVELKRLAMQCDFGAFLDDALRDRFVAGLRGKATQVELLKRKTSTFAEAVTIAKNAERAQRETQTLQHDTKPESPESIQAVHQGANLSSAVRLASSDKNCYRCGGPHDAND